MLTYKQVLALHRRSKTLNTNITMEYQFEKLVIHNPFGWHKLNSIYLVFCHHIFRAKFLLVCLKVTECAERCSVLSTNRSSRSPRSSRASMFATMMSFTRSTSSRTRSTCSTIKPCIANYVIINYHLILNNFKYNTN